MGHRRNEDDLVNEYVSRQRNIVLPDTVRNGRSLDAFFWTGSPHPTLVQRIAAWLLGIFEMGCGLEFIALAVKERIKEGFSISVVIQAILGLAIVLLGIRTFRNGFPRPPKQEHSNR
jgi:hypothetical protein